MNCTANATVRKEKAKGDKGEGGNIINVEWGNSIYDVLVRFNQPIYWFELAIYDVLIAINAFISDISSSNYIFYSLNILFP